MKTTKHNPILLTVMMMWISFFTCFSGTILAQNKAPDNAIEWTGSSQQKIYGLMTIWSEAKYTFPWFDELPQLDWDAKVQEFIPRVIAAQDMDSYYRVLMEFAVLLKDGHTSVKPPWFPFKQDDDMPAIEVQIVENKFIIAGAGESAEIKGQNIYPGLEILEVGENVPVATYYEENVRRYNTAGSPHGDRKWVVFLFVGTRGSQLSLKVKDINGTIRNITLTRNGLSNGKPFFPRLMQWAVIDRHLETTMLPEGILYVRIPSFTSNDFGKEFEDLIDTLDIAKTKGMILDLRYNNGGSSSIAGKILGCLIRQPVSSPLMKFPQYIGAYRAWGRKTELMETSFINLPRQGKTYLGPLVVLTGNASESTAEDVAISLQFSGRALLVGEKTAGSAGNPISVPLPGGGFFEVATFRAYYPDGTAYIHIGVQPDVEVNTTQKDLHANKNPILTKGIEVLKKWDTFSKTIRKFKPSASDTLRGILKKSAFDAAQSDINGIFAKRAEYYFLETEFNTLGYELITEGKFNDAIAVFKIEVQLYPNSWNAYDSLAESYMKAGDKDLAIENYEKSLNLNPNNKTTEDVLTQLRGNN